MELGRWPAPWRVAVVALSVLVNVPPLLQHPTAVVRYMWACAWPTADAFAAAAVPPFARRDVDGHTVVPPDQVLATDASASPFVVLPWFFAAVHAAPHDRAARLNEPPWLSSQPEIRPIPALTVEEATALAYPTFGVYDAALADQVLRAQQLRQRDRALTLAQKLNVLAPSGFADALTLESYRLLQRKDDAIAWLQGMPLERRQHPAINVVLALWDRDDGKEEEARALLRSSAAAYVGTPVAAAVDAPLSAWPADFASMTEDAALRVRVQ
jgi:hypothetical protein